MTENKTQINSKHKDRLFRFIFGSPERREYTLSLYNALNGSSYTDQDDFEFTTIDDVIYMGMKNDISFMIGTEMPLYEHQSTYNPNMPVRGLMYYGRLYDQWFSMNHKNRFGKNLIKIPTPQYVVFYNGIDQHEDREILKLSDAFMSEDKPDGYEWTAIMINVNEGHNKELLDNCKILQEYAAFINLVRKYIRIYGKKVGIDKAVDECIMNDILKDILVKNKSEVVGMCLTEYDEVEQRQFDREEGRLKRRLEGRLEGREEGEELKLIKQICKKIVKKKTPEEIAEDLDEDYSEIKIIYDEALKHAPEYEAQDIYSALHDGI